MRDFDSKVSIAQMQTRTQQRQGEGEEEGREKRVRKGGLFLLPLSPTGSGCRSPELSAALLASLFRQFFFFFFLSDTWQDDGRTCKRS